MIFFLHEGLLIMLVLTLKVKKVHTEAGGRREQNKTKLLGYNLSSFRAGEIVSSLSVLRPSTEARGRGG
jgi:hypothetical protein